MAKSVYVVVAQLSSSHSSHVAVSVRFAVVSSVLILHVYNFFLLHATMA